MNLANAPDIGLRNVSECAADGHRILADIRDQAFSYKQADAADAMLRYLARAEYHEGGDRVLRSIPQIAKGLKKPVEGMTMRQIRDHCENSITRTLAFLERLGYIERVERDLRHPDGQGIGILVVLPAGVAQSVRAAES